MTRKLVVIAVVIVAIIAAVWLIKRRGNGEEEQVALQTAEVTRGPLRVTVSATGALEPLTTVEVKSRSGGEISKLLVDAGDYVTAGQLIAQIDPTELQGKVDQARATADASNARVSQARLNASAQAAQTSTGIEEARASLAAAQARLGQAQAQLDQTRVSTEQQVVEARAALDSARARLQQAKAQEIAEPALVEADVSQAQASLRKSEQALAVLLAGARPEELAQAKARVAEAQAVAENARATLARQEQLLAKGFVSQQAADDARRVHETAVAQLESARQSLALVKAGARPEEIEQARAAVAQARAALEAAQARQVQVALKQRDREAAEAAVKQAEAGLALAQAGRKQVEVRAGEVKASARAVDQAAAALQRAEAGHLTDAARTEDVQMATAELRKAQSQLDDWEYNFEHTAIVAPRDGVVLEKHVEEGTLIPAGTSALAQGTAIVTLADITEMYVMAEVDEVDISRVQVGMPAEITVETLPNTKIRGEVIKVFPKGQEEQNVIYFPVRIKVLDLRPELRPGMTADVTIVVAEKRDCLQVPDSAIDRTGGKTRVQVLPSPEGEPVEREVKVGMTNWEQAEILHGLREGEQVVLPTAAVPADAQGRQERPGQTGRRATHMLQRSSGR